MKWLAITVITILAFALAVEGYFLWQYTTELDEAEAEIVTLEGNVSSLEGDVSTLEGDVAVLEKELADSEAEVSTLEADLSEAESQIETLQDSVAAAQALYDTLKSDLNISLTSLDEILELAINDFRQTWALFIGDDAEYYRLSALEGGLVYSVDDAELTQLWEDMERYTVEGNDAKFDESYALYYLRLAELLEEGIKAIEAQLSE